jgi:hypothetical protein
VHELDGRLETPSEVDRDTCCGQRLVRAVDATQDRRVGGWKRFHRRRDDNYRAGRSTRQRDVRVPEDTPRSGAIVRHSEDQKARASLVSERGKPLGRFAELDAKLRVRHSPASRIRED